MKDEKATEKLLAELQRRLDSWQLQISQQAALTSPDSVEKTALQDHEERLHRREDFMRRAS